MYSCQHSSVILNLKNTNKKIDCVWMSIACFSVVLCVCLCTGHFVAVLLNLTCLYCLQNFFERLFGLYFYNWNINYNDIYTGFFITCELIFWVFEHVCLWDKGNYSYYLTYIRLPLLYGHGNAWTVLARTLCSGNIGLLLAYVLLLTQSSFHYRNSKVCASIHIKIMYRMFNETGCGVSKTVFNIILYI